MSFASKRQPSSDIDLLLLLSMLPPQNPLRLIRRPERLVALKALPNLSIRVVLLRQLLAGRLLRSIRRNDIENLRALVVIRLLERSETGACGGLRMHPAP